MDTKDLYIIIVTYNNRWNFITRSLEKLNQFNPNVNIVIVNNGSHSPDDYFLNAFKFQSQIILNAESNLGSAAAFKKGILHVTNISNDCLILLLDDDNIVDQNSVVLLISAWNNKVSDFDVDTFAVMGLRTQRKYLMNTANGFLVASQFPQNNEFLGFGKRLIDNRFIKRKDIIKSEFIKIPCAPYGGFLFHIALISQIGLPDERFYVYADDFEFTYRITKNGGSIFLIPDAKIEDIEESWQVKPSKSVFKPKFLFPQNPLIYLSVRNFVYFQSKNLVTSRFVFTINRFLYSFFLLVIAIFTGRLNEFNRFSRAVSDGLKGKFDNNYYIK